MKGKKVFVIAGILILVAACNMPFSQASEKTPAANPTARATTPPTRIQAAPIIGDLIFCESFDEQSGQPVKPSTRFAAGTQAVNLVFTFKNMRNGQPWSLQMERDGTPMEGIPEEAWQDDEEGWVAYELTEELSDNPMAGQYTVRILVGSEVKQSASFEVEAPVIQRSSFPAFGPVQFALDITDGLIPIEPGREFEKGVQKIYAVFPYVNMKAGQKFSREWLYNGKEIARKDLGWDEETEGITYAYLNDDGGLPAGKYQLNLYLDGQISRSASFEVVGPKATSAPTTRPPSTPQELIDARVLPTWQLIANFDRESVRWVGNFVLDNHLKIRIDPSYTGLAAFSYSCTQDPPKYAGDVGEIRISPSFFQKTSRVELAGVLMHEITHAIQRVQGKKCGCTIEKEYQSYSVQGGFWVLAGEQDLITEYVGNDIFNAAGKFDNGKFWQAVKKIYGSSCPDY